MTVRKRFGQHFLNDRNIIRKLIRHIAPRPADHFVEIGPGRGALTRPLLERVARVDAIEIDRELAAELPRLRLSGGTLVVHPADALRFDYGSLARASGVPLRLAGNLPYNISTPLLFRLLADAPLFEDLYVMLQKEVGERIVAPPGSRRYGRLSVAIQARCRTDWLFDISRGCFSPPPRVESCFIALKPVSDPGIRSFPVFDRLVTLAFGMRRKQLGNALKARIDPPTLHACGIEPSVRAEQLTVDDFIRLANHPQALERLDRKTGDH